MSKVLIVDDKAGIRLALETLCQVNDIGARSAADPEAALGIVAEDDIGVVVQDMNFTPGKTSGEEGAHLFRALRELDPSLPVVLITAWTSLENAVELVREGAADYIKKPWDDTKLVQTLKNLMRLQHTERENTRLRAHLSRSRSKLASEFDLRGLVYRSEAMHELIQLALKVAPSDAPILITGPNGSGKEKVAEVVQANSRRKDKPFLTVNLGALPENLFEAELFGAEAGAFTGAQRSRAGRFEAADGGTLFLDELGTLPLSCQAKLLRCLQTGEYQRLGSSTTRQADVRLLSATNEDLPRAIAEGRFREDLFYRLNVIELRVPPLAERSADVAPLAEALLRQHAGAERAGLKFSPSCEQVLAEHSWPGNVRELSNRLQRAVLVAAGDEISPVDIDLQTTLPLQNASAESPQLSGEDVREKREIEETLARCKGVIARAAAELGLTRQALYRRIARLRIRVPDRSTR